jgi:hypothetical protein
MDWRAWLIAILRDGSAKIESVEDIVAINQGAPWRGFREITVKIYVEIKPEGPHEPLV